MKSLKRLNVKGTEVGKNKREVKQRGERVEMTREKRGFGRE
jgi:hypothetical protein